jgi:hypothetical protein
MLARMIPVERARDLLSDRVRGLLKSPTAK